MLEKRTFYNYLSNEKKDLVDKIDNHEILGATTHLDIISEIFIDLTKNDLETEQILELIENTKNYYFETRGSSSRAIINGINLLLKGINDRHYINKSEVLEALKTNQSNFNKLNKINLDKILKFSNNELSEFNNILLYDYSSTVENAVARILENNEKEFNLFISESSAIDGGSPYFKLSEYNNANISFFPDSVLGYYISKSDCCLMGAETFYHDGTGFNTIGSDIVSILSKYYSVPLYFITPMNKLDDRRIRGVKKDKVLNDFKDKYKFPERLLSKFDTIIPELIGVKSEFIEAYITEYGVIPSNQMFVVSMKYLENIKVGDNE